VSGGRSDAGAKTDRHPVRSGQQVTEETGTKTPSPGEAPAPDASHITCPQAWSPQTTGQHVVEADDLITHVMADRGYPVEDFESQSELVSV
jgi:hypothetical protein